MTRQHVAKIAVGLLLYAAPLKAGTVALLCPPKPTPALIETQSRLHGELLSVGLEVRLLDAPPNFNLSATDSPLWLPAVDGAGAIDAVVDLTGKESPLHVDVWIREKSRQRFELSGVVDAPNTENASELLAIRAIEVLRSSFLENEMLGGNSRSKRPLMPALTPEPLGTRKAPPQHLNRIGIAIGAAAVSSLQGVGPTILPLVRLDWAPRPWLVLGGQFAAFGSRPSVVTTNGSARIAQAYGTIGGQYRILSSEGFSPFFGLSMGPRRTTVDGDADLPRQGHLVSQWSFLFEASVGVYLRLSNRFYLTFAAQAHLAEPSIAVHISDSIAATSGRPDLGLAVTIGAWL